MTAPGRRVVVVGGGIVGLAVAERVVRDEPSSRVTVLEKEYDWALHQTGRNMAGTLALTTRLAASRPAGAQRGSEPFWTWPGRKGCSMHGPASLVVATSTTGSGLGLGALYDRGLANGSMSAG